MASYSSQNSGNGGPAQTNHHRATSRVFYGEDEKGEKYEWGQDLKIKRGGLGGGGRGGGRQFEDSDDDDDDDHEDFGDLRVYHDEKLPKAKFVSHYIIGSTLGEGAHAVVKEGMDSRSLRIVAIKIVDKDRIKKIPNGLDNIQREISIMKALKKHSNIIQLVDVIDDFGGKKKLYIVLELANGCNVQDLIEKAPNKKVPTSQAAYLFKQLLNGLQYIHGKNVVHRDIKPANMMLTTDLELKVSDFGVAEFLNAFDQQDFVSRTTGSPAFQAPEIANGDPVYSGMKIDVWAAGVTLYYMLVGSVPFDSGNLMDLFQLIGKAEYSVPDFVDPQAADLIRHMMDKDVEQRFSIRDCINHPWIKSAPLKKDSDDSWIKVELRQPKITKMVSLLYQDDESIQESASKSVSHEISAKDSAVSGRQDSGGTGITDGDISATSGRTCLIM